MAGKPSVVFAFANAQRQGDQLGKMEDGHLMRNNPIYIHAGCLIDGSGAAVQRKMRIGLHNGIIQSIRKITEPLPPSAKKEASVLDLSDCTLLPGLIDCHVHLALPATAQLRPAGVRSPEDRSRILMHLKQYLATGVMAVRDGGDAAGGVLRSKAHPAVKSLPIVVRAAGTAWHRPGRYGHLIGHCLPSKKSLVEAVLQERADVDHIKIVNSGLNSLTVFGQETAPQFGSDDMIAAVRAARRRGFKTMVHANGKAAVKIALDAGCDSIEHGFFMGTDNLHRMADSRTTWVPTAYTMQALKQRMKRRREAVDVVQKNFDHQLEQIRIARQLGVRIALGTDAGSAGVMHGQALVEEMSVYRDAGYPIEQVIACATSHAAPLLGLLQQGRLRPNMQANLIAVKGKPAQLPQSLEKIEQIIYKGKRVNLDSMSTK